MSQCAACSKEGATACCSACKYVFYCNIKCQRKNWRQHKKECKIWNKMTTQKNENSKTKPSFMSQRMLCFLLEGYFKECFISSIFSTVMRDSLMKQIQQIIIFYLYTGFRSNGDCKAITIDILELFACVIGDNLLDFDIADYGNVFEEATLGMMEGMTLKTFKSKYFNIFCHDQMSKTFRQDAEELQKLKAWNSFVNEAMYGDVLICTSAWINHGYNDYDFVIGLNSECDLAFYQFSVDNGIVYNKESKDERIFVAREMKDSSPNGYYLNYYEEVYALYPIYADVVKNRNGEWVEIGFIEQILQKYSNLSGEEILIIMQFVGFSGHDYESKLFFNHVDVERDRMAKELFERMQANNEIIPQ
eukprot:393611_1